MTTTGQPAPPAGPATDARGLPAIDPTANVLALVAASISRQDDLRNEERRHRKEDTRNSRREAKLRAIFYEKLRVQESKRIDAIRAVDVDAVSRAAQVSAQQASTLAAQVATSAETLRGQVAAAAQAATVALAAALEPIQKSIDDLRRAQYEQQGQKAQQVDSRSEKRDDRSNVQWAFGFAMTVVVAVGSIVTALIATRGH